MPFRKKRCIRSRDRRSTRSIPYTRPGRWSARWCRYRWRRSPPAGSSVEGLAGGDGEAVGSSPVEAALHQIRTGLRPGVASGARDLRSDGPRGRRDDEVGGQAVDEGFHSSGSARPDRGIRQRSGWACRPGQAAIDHVPLDRRQEMPACLARSTRTRSKRRSKTRTHGRRHGRAGACHGRLASARGAGAERAPHPPATGGRRPAPLPSRRQNFLPIHHRPREPRRASPSARPARCSKETGRAGRSGSRHIVGSERLRADGRGTRFVEAGTSRPPARGCATAPRTLGRHRHTPLDGGRVLLGDLVHLAHRLRHLLDPPLCSWLASAIRHQRRQLLEVGSPPPPSSARLVLSLRQVLHLPTLSAISALISPRRLRAALLLGCLALATTAKPPLLSPARAVSTAALSAGCWSGRRSSRSPMMSEIFFEALLDQSPSSRPPGSFHLPALSATAFLRLASSRAWRALSRSGAPVALSSSIELAVSSRAARLLFGPRRQVGVARRDLLRRRVDRLRRLLDLPHHLAQTLHRRVRVVLRLAGRCRRTSP